MENLTLAQIVLMVLNVLLALVAYFGAQVGKNLIAAIKELKETDKALAEKFELYARREDLADIKGQLSGIFHRLEDIRDRTSEKVSREELRALLTEIKQEIRDANK